MNKIIEKAIKDFENLEVGKTFEYYGNTFIVRKGEECSECVFCDFGASTCYRLTKNNDIPACTKNYRKDKQDVYFEEVE